MNSLLLLLQSGFPPLSYIFWGLMILWVVLGIAWYRRTPSATYIVAGGNLLIFFLFVLIGLKIFT